MRESDPRGQVTVPQRVHVQAGLLRDTEAGFEIVCGRNIPKPRGKRAIRGQRAVARLRGSLKYPKLSTGELMALTRGEKNPVWPVLAGTNVRLAPRIASILPDRRRGRHQARALRPAGAGRLRQVC